MRDDFTAATIKNLSERAGSRCSNPGCGRPTKGPDSANGVTSIGVAAHITAASAGGPRFDPTLEQEQRRDSANGIWLCQTCSRLIDSDATGYPKEKLIEWKSIRELSAALELRGFEVGKSRGFGNLERKLPELIDEMRTDLRESPYIREFICMSKRMTFNGGRVPLLAYYTEDHDQLLAKVQIMENYNAVSDSSINDVPRYRFSEDFIDYLLPE